MKPGVRQSGVLVTVAGFLLGVALAASLTRPLPPVLHADAHPFEWLDAAPLRTSGFGWLQYRARSGHALRVRAYRATGFDPQSGPIWFVMHGAGRTAESYLDAAAAAAERYAALALAIEFPRTLYPDHSDYTLGVTVFGDADASALAQQRWRDPSMYTYAEVENLFDGVREALDGEQPGYFLFGHSAGAQFTHRALTFLPGTRVLRAVAANAGWYTLPVFGSTPAETMPYGLGATPVTDVQRRRLLGAPLAVLLGERDTATPDEDELLRDTPEAMAQGASRLERGRHYVDVGRDAARNAGVEFGWSLALAPRAGHDVDHVIESAARLLFEPDTRDCDTTPGQAASVEIIELLADPPAGAAGDTNGDGRRDPLEDEYVLLANAGERRVCLSGWTLGDADDPERHVFPLGSELAPGTRLLVFGGGVPTGEFAAASVQRATFGGRLSLSNAGDILTLRDANDDIVSRVAWGDCGGQPCAAADWPGDLDIERAIAPADDGGWRPATAGDRAAAAAVAGRVRVPDQDGGQRERHR